MSNVGEKIEQANILQTKSFQFSVKIFRMYEYLLKVTKDSIISRQILRSGTSIGANIEESIGSQSVKELYRKLSISYREARETKYWLEY